MVWHYRNADPDFGAWQAKELLDHLESVLQGTPVEVVSGGTGEPATSASHSNEAIATRRTVLQFDIT